MATSDTGADSNGDVSAHARLSQTIAGLEKLPVADWQPCLGSIETAELVRVVARAVRQLLPEWATRRPGDTRPKMALDAVEEWLAHPCSNLVEHCKALAKACTKARRASFGYDHRIAEAARALALVPSAGSDDKVRELVFEALESTEQHLLYASPKFSNVFRGKEEAVRVQILDAFREA